jgi:hypothetical protein
MKKSKPQSKQVPFCTTFLHETFSLFQHHSNLFETTLSMNTNIRGPNTPWCKDKTRSEQNQGEKWKLNAVLKKENTRWTIRVKNGVFLANEKQVNLLQKKFVGVQPFITENKTK